jgi:hypothetical protein
LVVDVHEDVNVNIDIIDVSGKYTENSTVLLSALNACSNGKVAGGIGSLVLDVVAAIKFVVSLYVDRVSFPRRRVQAMNERPIYNAPSRVMSPLLT